ncbi:hypothetical protein HBB16_14965 [Pseudonocardia sp. MCCB 268]|nr:hypothetical protein [Pseudonocardia cytotoxica]
MSAQTGLSRPSSRSAHARPGSCLFDHRGHGRWAAVGRLDPGWPWP